jgi:hypothetical protein
MWYYTINHQPVGPVDTDIIEALLRAGTINGLTLVWREGMTDWKLLDETDLAVLLRDNLQMPAAAVPPPLPRYPGYAPYPRVNLKSLNSLFTWWLCLLGTGVLIILTIAVILFLNVHSLDQLNNDAATTAFLIGMGALSIAMPLLTAAGVILYILHYRFWQVVQDGFANLTPGMAIGLLFVPYFNYYWIFRAVYGLSKELNRYIERHFPNALPTEVRKAHPALSLINIITSFGCWFVYMGYLILFNPAMKGAPVSDALLQQFFGHLAIVIVVMAAVMFILNLLNFVDFYLTSRSILEKEGQA